MFADFATKMTTSSANRAGIKRIAALILAIVLLIAGVRWSFTLLGKLGLLGMGHRAGIEPTLDDYRRCLDHSNRGHGWCDEHCRQTESADGGLGDCFAQCVIDHIADRQYCDRMYRPRPSALPLNKFGTVR
mgnify:CR=1 FL=1